MRSLDHPTRAVCRVSRGAGPDPEDPALSLRVAHLPLLALCAAALAACASPPEPASQPAPSPLLRRVVVAPLNVAVRAPEVLEGKEDPVWEALLGCLQQRDLQLAALERESAESLWREASTGLDLSDRREALYTAYSRFAIELARHRDFDAVIVPSLVLRPARLLGWQAFWDGVQRDVPNAAVMNVGLEHAAPPGELRVAGLSGTIAGVSLHVAVLRPDGSLLHDGFGGLAVLQEAHPGRGPDERPGFAPRAEPFSDADSVDEGVRLALEWPALTLARGR